MVLNAYYWPTQDSHVVAKRDTNQSIGIGAWTDVELDDEDLDIKDEFNTTTYTFTASELGIYLITGTVGLTAASASCEALLELYVNGSDSYRIAGQYHTLNLCEDQLSGSLILSLDANDTVKLRFRSDVASTLAGGTMRMCIAKLA